MAFPSGSTGHSAPEYTSKLFVLALLVGVLTPIMFSLFVPMVASEPYDQELKEFENEYYNSTGSTLATNREIWPLVGIYTAYGTNGDKYGVTPDGWIYGEKIRNYSPSQYAGNAATEYTVSIMDNNLYYYTQVAGNDLTHTGATQIQGGWDYSNASVYASVVMDNSHKSDVFFRPEGKTETGEGFYYQFSGYRYAFSPIRGYTLDNGGTEIEIQPFSSSLSLIWYQYASLSGIAGMLSIQGSDQGLSYLTAADILRAFNSVTYSSTFDMTFNNIKMHLTIMLDPARISGGMDAGTCYNQGYWSVMVSSDSTATASVGNATYNLSIENIWQTMIDLFTFNLAEKYEISGWEATIASILVSLPLYAFLLSLALSNYYILIGVALLGAIQTATNWWPF